MLINIVHLLKPALATNS